MIFTTKFNFSTNQINLSQIEPVLVKDTFLSKIRAKIIMGSRLFKFNQKAEARLHGDEDNIIRQIRSERFNPDKQHYVFTGGHYPDLYVRNLGIFYNSILDPYIDTPIKDWRNRQQIALQTVALDLELLKLSKRLPTTYVNLNKNTFVPVMSYCQPSDSLYAIFYTLSALKDYKFFSRFYSKRTKPKHILETKRTCGELIAKHKATLLKTFTQYKNNVIDSKTGLIRNDIYLSSARDGIKRKSSFYDNVIAWATFKLADTSGVFITTEKELEEQKRRIIDNFWDDDLGIFKDELHEHSAQFSADSLITVPAGFFDLKIRGDVIKLKRILDYIDKTGLNSPFPLRYSFKVKASKLYLPVLLFARSYMDESIWSNWGVEYIKALILLSKDNEKLLDQAIKNLGIYKHNILNYGGYPELYNKDGSIYSTRFYKSVLRTSWVIEYEKARAMLKDRLLNHVS